MPQHFTDHKSTLVQVIACCRQATSHYLKQCWLRSPAPYDIRRPQWVNQFRNNIQWNFNWKSYISMLENAFENVACKMVAILSWPWCVKFCYGKQHKKNIYYQYHYYICWLPGDTRSRDISRYDVDLVAWNIITVTSHEHLGISNHQQLLCCCFFNSLLIQESINASH